MYIHIYIYICIYIYILSSDLWQPRFPVGARAWELWAAKGGVSRSRPGVLLGLETPLLEIWRCELMRSGTCAKGYPLQQMLQCSHDTILYHIITHDKLYDMIWYDMLWYDASLTSVGRFGSASTDPCRRAAARLVLLVLGMIHVYIVYYKYIHVCMYIYIYIYMIMYIYIYILYIHTHHLYITERPLGRMHVDHDAAGAEVGIVLPPERRARFPHATRCRTMLCDTCSCTHTHTRTHTRTRTLILQVIILCDMVYIGYKAKYLHYTRLD